MHRICVIIEASIYTGVQMFFKPGSEAMSNDGPGDLGLDVLLLVTDFVLKIAFEQWV